MLGKSTRIVFAAVLVSACTANGPSGGLQVIAPAVPTEVEAMAGDGFASVSWLTPENTIMYPVFSWTVTSSPGNFVVTVPGDDDSATVNGLTDGTAYTFTVYGTNMGGNGPVSIPSNPVTPSNVPTVPLNVTAMVPQVGGVNAEDTAIVSWEAPESAGGSPLTAYVVTAVPVAEIDGGVDGDAGQEDAGTDAGATDAGPAGGVDAGELDAGTLDAGFTEMTIGTQAFTVSCNSATSCPTSTTLQNLDDSVSYVFTVVAENSIGFGPISTASSSVTTVFPPGPPMITTVAPEADDSVIVYWDPPSDDGGSFISAYLITPLINGEPAPGAWPAMTDGATPKYELTNLTNMQMYTLQVVAVNLAGEGPPAVSAPFKASM